MLPQGLETIGLFIYCESEQVKQAASRKIVQLLNKIQAVEKDDDLEDSDDQIEEALKQADDTSPSDEFLLLTLLDKSKPVVNIFDGKAVNWAKNEPLRNQVMFD